METLYIEFKLQRQTNKLDPLINYIFYYRIYELNSCISI